MNPEDILALGEQALADGLDPETVFQLVRDKAKREGLGGDLGLALKLRVESKELKEEQQLIERVANRGVARNVGGMLAQGATLGTLPDFLKLIGQEERGEQFRTFVEETREVEPLAAGVTEAAGGILVPGLGAVRGAKATSRGLTAAGGLATRLGAPSIGGLLAAPATTAAVVGAGTGAAAGGLFGFTEATGEPISARLSAAAEGATDPIMIGSGMLLGPVVGFSGSRLKRIFGRKKRGQRVAAGLEEATGTSRDINSFRDRADLNVETARTGLDALERNNAEIISSDLEEFLDNLRERADISPNLTSASREVAAGERFANLRDMRKLQNNLRTSQNFTEANLLSDILDDAVPGHRAINAEFAMAKDIREAIELGQQGGGVTFRGERIQLDTGANFEKALEVIRPEAHEALKTGVMHRELQKILGRRTGSSPDILRRLADDSGVDMRLRQMFNSPEIAEEFIRGLDKEISAEELRKLLVKGGVLIVVGAGATAAFGASASSFLGNQ